MKSVFNMIIAGSGPGFGSGHAGRMSELRRLLNKDHSPSELFLLEGTPGVPEALRVRRSSDNDASTGVPLPEWLGGLGPAGKQTGNYGATDRSVVILDARDLDPGIFPRPIIALDNRCAGREEFLQEPGIYFHDTLPHPGAPLGQVLRNCLISEDVIAARRSPAGVPTRDPAERALVYVGNFGIEKQLDPVLAHLAARGTFKHILRVGGGVPTLPGIRHAMRLQGAEYARALAASDVVFSYFGMTILEAWYLGRRPVLYAVASDVHGELARDLAGQSAIPYLETPAHWQSQRWEGSVIGPGPTGEGYAILRELVAALHGD